MSDTPCACGCGQDAATIEYLERSRAVAVRQLGEALGRAERAEAKVARVKAMIADFRQSPTNVDYCRHVADSFQSALTPPDPPQGAASAPEAPGHGEGAGNAADGDSRVHYDPATGTATVTLTPNVDGFMEALGRADQQLIEQAHRMGLLPDQEDTDD